MIGNILGGKKCKPVSIRKYRGESDVSALFSHKGFTLKDGEYVIFDMGKESVGGYPVFKVKDFGGCPKVRISYSDRMIPYESENTMGIGDFTRGSCTYLGVELPVMPANPYRYENYSITRKGEYFYPLIQGQERFIYIAVSGENAFVNFSDFYIKDDTDDSNLVGYFESDDYLLNRIWLASANTVRIATIRARQWDMHKNNILLRKLTAGDSGAVISGGDYKEIMAKFSLLISDNPEHVSGIVVLIFSNGENGYKIKINTDGVVTLEYDNQILKTASIKIIDNAYYKAKVVGNRKGITLYIADKKVIAYCGNVETGGSFGFYMESEWRAAVKDLIVISDGKTVYEKDMGLAPFSVTDTGLFISDGAKRDRLPWTGDLDWAFEGGWYAFGKGMKAFNTLEIMGFNSNEEGYIFGTCYPENKVKPKRGDYGYYQSDMFSVWYVLSALSYENFSADERVEKLYGVMKDCMDYVWKYVDNDGLFNQRYETSKGLWDHELGDVGKNTYTNLMILEGYRRLSEYASKIGKNKDSEVFSERARKMKKSIFENLYSEELGGFIKRKDWFELCDMANPFAMGKGLVNKEQAQKIAKNYKRITHAYGKIAILMIKGLYDYGYPEKAYELLTGKLPMYNGEWLFSYVDWLGVVDNPDYPETVYECMHNPPFNFGVNGNWGDLSHPDSAVNGVISSRIAGIIAIESGFKKILVRPCMHQLKKLKCGVPAENGLIEIEITVEGGKNNVKVKVPEGTEVLTDFSLLNGEVKFNTEFYAVV